MSLREACETQPSRVAAWVLRVLAARHDDERRLAFDHLERHASALVADAARERGVAPWWPRPVPPDEVLPIAEQALALLRGNRASSCPFWLAPRNGRVRSAIYGSPVTTPAWEHDELAALRALAAR